MDRLQALYQVNWSEKTFAQLADNEGNYLGYIITDAMGFNYSFCLKELIEVVKKIENEGGNQNVGIEPIKAEQVGP